MAPQGAKRWLRQVLGASLLLALLLPQAAPATEIHYLKDTTFLVPFKIEVNQQAAIKSVILYYSDNDGKDYHKAVQALPSQTSFRFTAPHPGWYSFVVQAEYNDGRLVPDDPYRAQPGLKISVDTTPPLIAAFRQVATNQGTLSIEWDIRDDNLDILTLRIEYKAVGGAAWIPLNILQSPYGVFPWTPTTPAPQYDVHVAVSDRAKNTSERYLRVTPGQTQSVASPIPPANPPPTRAMMVNTRNLKLSYDLADVGKSNVAKIQVWATQDGVNWKSLAEQPPANPPNPATISVQVEKEGRWGFKLIAKSGVGKGEPPPDRNTQPDSWVEVDETKPAVKIQATDVTGTPDNGQMTIRWTASDKHLAERPITISYSTDRQQWTTMVTGLPNDGRYVWSIPTDDRLPHHSCFIKVEAVDQAGNIGEDQTLSPVVTDLSVPKVRIRGVEAGGIQGQSFAPGISAPPGGIAQMTGVEPAAPPAPAPIPVAPAPAIITPTPVPTGPQSPANAAQQFPLAAPPPASAPPLPPSTTR